MKRRSVRMQVGLGLVQFLALVLVVLLSTVQAGGIRSSGRRQQGIDGSKPIWSHRVNPSPFSERALQEVWIDRYDDNRTSIRVKDRVTLRDGIAYILGVDPTTEEYTVSLQSPEPDPDPDPDPGGGTPCPYRYRIILRALKAPEMSKLVQLKDVVEFQPDPASPYPLICFTKAYCWRVNTGWTPVLQCQASNWSKRQSDHALWHEAHQFWYNAGWGYTTVDFIQDNYFYETGEIGTGYVYAFGGANASHLRVFYQIKPY